MKQLYLLLIIILVSCDSDHKDATNQKYENPSHLICDCYQTEHAKIGIDFFKEKEAYKAYIDKVNPSSGANLSLSLISFYKKMHYNSFDAKLADTVFQQNYLKSIDVALVKKCINKYAHLKGVQDLINELENIGMSDSYSIDEQLEILQSLEKKLNLTKNVTWVEPMQLNAFFYMYDRYNKEFGQPSIEVILNNMLPPPPPEMPFMPKPIEEIEVEVD